MRKKTIGGWFIDNELKFNDDVNNLKNTRDLQDDLSFSKPNILVNNLIHHLSTCAEQTNPLTVDVIRIMVMEKLLIIYILIKVLEAGKII